MESRERVLRTLNFQANDRAPRELWALPGVSMYRRDELDAMLARFPSDFIGPDLTQGSGPDVQYGTGYKTKGTPAVVGTYIDEWGCPFTVAEPGVIGEVKEPPLADWSALDSLVAPDEILQLADFSRVNAGCAATNKFVKAGTTIRPFERMQFLRGSENLFMDLAWGVPEVIRLRDLVHEFFVRELASWVKTDVDGISFMDDWGTQSSLLISPAMWRDIFKPLYVEYCEMIHRAGKKVFFHSDGHIRSIIPELIEIGVDALNSQLFCQDIEELGKEFKGKITFWGEIDRQWVLPFGTPKDVRDAVKRVRTALDDGNGGVIAQCEWGVDVPAENIAAVFEAWDA
jgi:uroporphyrinogen decarboxylase